MTSLHDSARAVLESPALAHLVTLNPDGSPQVSAVWVGLDGDEIVAGHLPEHRKVRNIRNDSRVALSVETGKRNATGLNEYLVIYGTARITEGGAAELLQRLARTYLGPDVRFPPMDSPPPGYHLYQGGSGLWRGSLGRAALTAACTGAAGWRGPGRPGREDRLGTRRPRTVCRPV
jgi:PPOX class probable F420-dependent enzyme